MYNLPEISFTRQMGGRLRSEASEPPVRRERRMRLFPTYCLRSQPMVFSRRRSSVRESIRQNRFARCRAVARHRRSDGDWMAGMGKFAKAFAPVVIAVSYACCAWPLTMLEVGKYSLDRFLLSWDALACDALSIAFVPPAFAIACLWTFERAGVPGKTASSALSAGLFFSMVLVACWIAIGDVFGSLASLSMSASFAVSRCFLQ